MDIIEHLADRYRYQLSATQLLEQEDITDWTVWSQAGPSDDTLLVSLQARRGVMWDSLFGYMDFPLDVTETNLENSGWVYMGDL